MKRKIALGLAALLLVMGLWGCKAEEKKNTPQPSEQVIDGGGDNKVESKTPTPYDNRETTKKTPEALDITDFSAVLTPLPVDKLESLKIATDALDKFEERFGVTDTVLALYITFSDAVCENFGEMTAEKLEEAKRYGLIEFEAGEGTRGIRTDIVGLGKKYEATISDAMKRFIEMRDQVDKHPVASDGALMLSWKELGDHMEQWLDFSSENPQLVEVMPWAQKHAQWLLAVYVGAIHMDNTPVYEKKKLRPEVRSEYEDFLKRNPGSAAEKPITQVLAIWDEAKDTYSDDVQKKLTEVQPYV